MLNGGRGKLQPQLIPIPIPVDPQPGYGRYGNNGGYGDYGGYRFNGSPDAINERMQFTVDR